MSKLTFTYTESHNYNKDMSVTRFTDDDTGAWVELHYDTDPCHPIDEYTEGVAVAFRERDQYVGTAEAIPDDLAVSCKACNGYGNDPDRFAISLYYYGPDVAEGSESAMDAVYQEYREKGVNAHMNPADCAVCKGSGEVHVETIEEYVKIERAALGSYVFSSGQYGEATAVIYITSDDFTDPEGAAKAWAEEYQSWAEGEVYGIVGSDDESCWGFIGYDNAKETAVAEFLPPLIEERRERREANTVRGTN